MFMHISIVQYSGACRLTLVTVFEPGPYERGVRCVVCKETMIWRGGRRRSETSKHPADRRNRKDSLGPGRSSDTRAPPSDDFAVEDQVKRQPEPRS
jgi:hypothetical protein